MAISSNINLLFLKSGRVPETRVFRFWKINVVNTTFDMVFLSFSFKFLAYVNDFSKWSMPKALKKWGIWRKILAQFEFNTVHELIFGDPKGKNSIFGYITNLINPFFSRLQQFLSTTTTTNSKFSPERKYNSKFKKHHQNSTNFKKFFRGRWWF